MDQPMACRLRAAALALALAVPAAPVAAGGAVCPASPEAAAVAARDALYAADGPALSALVHGGRGMRISLSAFVAETDRVLDREAAAALWTDGHDQYWGYEEGTGDPITVTGAALVERYIAPLPLADAAPAPHDSEGAPASTVDNAALAYPDAEIVEFSTGEGPADWAALRMAVVPEDGCFRLAGLIVARWSP